MNVRFLILAALILGFTKTQAQNWKPGLVVRTEGDTLKGELSRNRIKPTEFEFKTTTGQVVNYTPESVKALFIPGEVYYERVSVNETNQEFQVFMDVLVFGKADLLEYKGRYFLRMNDEAIVELLIETSKKEINGQEVIVATPLYKQVLRGKLIDCPSAVEAVTSTALIRNALVRLINKYNACFGSIEVSPKLTRSRSKLYVGLQYGYNQSHLTNIKNLIVDESTYGDKVSQSFPGVSIQYSFRVPKGVSLQISAYRLAYQFTSSATVRNAKSPFDNWRFTYDVGFSPLVFPIVARYSFFSDRVVQPFLGIGTGIQINQKIQGSSDAFEPNGTRHPGDLPAIRFFDKKTVTFISMAGVNFKLGNFLIGGGVNFEYSDSPVSFTLRGISYVVRANNSTIGANVSVAYAILH